MIILVDIDLLIHIFKQIKGPYVSKIFALIAFIVVSFLLIISIRFSFFV